MSAPLSIVTLGNSMAVMEMGSPAGQPRRTYSDVLADLLWDAGVPATVALESKWFDFLKDAVLEWEQRVRPHRPQVLIVHYGFNESQPWLTPAWLLRHLLRKEQYTTRRGKIYRTKVTPQMWKMLRSYRRIAAPIVGTRLTHTSPRRFERALRRVVQLASAERGCLVVMVDINPPPELINRYLPGQSARYEVFQEVIRRTVKDLDSPDVRLVLSSEICSELEHAGLPDGMHYSRAAHVAVATAINTVIHDWLAADR